MDITKDIRVYETNAFTVGSPYSLPNLEQVKKQHPCISMGKAAQFTLWEEEVKTARGIPGSCQYNTDDKAVRPSRFKGISFGYDYKSNNKHIPRSPGPADYYIVTSKNNSVNRGTFNYHFKNGGLETQPSS